MLYPSAFRLSFDSAFLTLTQLPHYREHGNKGSGQNFQNNVLSKYRRNQMGVYVFCVLTREQEQRNQ